MWAQHMLRAEVRRRVLEEHTRQVRLGYLDIVPFVHRQIELRSPFEAHAHAMLFLCLDAIEETELAALDMTAEGYVREWARRGRRSGGRLQSWERRYQDAGLIEEARRRGYIWLSGDVACSVHPTHAGEALLASAN